MNVATWEVSATLDYPASRDIQRGKIHFPPGDEGVCTGYCHCTLTWFKYSTNASADHVLM